MKVLFISSGNSGILNPLIKAQGDSLKEHNIKIDYYLIKGKGVIGYLKNIPSIKKEIKKNKYDLVHAHFSLSAILAHLSGCKPLVISLMGSDVKGKHTLSKFINFFIKKNYGNALIVKSMDMRKDLNLNNVSIIPNGVNMNMFKPIDYEYAIERLKWDKRKKHILFAANPSRQEKNFYLAEKAIKKLDKEKTVIHYLKDIPHEVIPYMMNASDVILLTSKWEGSPNVIKEAMACNRPIVSTNVGDVEWLFNSLEGHYLTTSDEDDIAKNLKNAIAFQAEYNSTNGRQRIISINLDADSVAKRIKRVYIKILSTHQHNLIT